MRAFIFVAAGAQYAMDAQCIQAVHPLVRARAVPGGPAWLLGVIDVHGELVPLIDACSLLGGGAVQRTLGARVLLVDSGSAGEETRARFALAVDRVLDPMHIDYDGAWRGGTGTVPWLGAVVQHAKSAAQVFDPCALASAHRQLTAAAAPDPGTEAAEARRLPVPPGGEA